MVNTSVFRSRAAFACIALLTTACSGENEISQTEITTDAPRELSASNTGTNETTASNYTISPYPLLGEIGVDIEMIGVTAGVLKHRDGDHTVETDVPDVDWRPIRRAVLDAFTSSKCGPMIPVLEPGSGSDLQRDYGDKGLLISVRFALQDSLDNAQCEYGAECTYASMQFYFHMGNWSQTTMIPKLFVFQNEELEAGLAAAAAADALQLANSSFRCPENR